MNHISLQIRVNKYNYFFILFRHHNRQYGHTIYSSFLTAGFGSSRHHLVFDFLTFTCIRLLVFLHWPQCKKRRMYVMCMLPIVVAEWKWRSFTHTIWSYDIIFLKKVMFYLFIYCKKKEIFFLLFGKELSFSCRSTKGIIKGGDVQ
jgi:hypothetical protein